MNKRIVSYIILAALIVFTFALGVNNYNSGIYADTHYVSGASVGWFAPNEVLTFVIATLLTISFAIYVFISTRK